MVGGLEGLQDNRSGSHTRNPEVPGGSSEVWTSLEVTTGCHRARASQGMYPRIISNPTGKIPLFCPPATSGSRLAAADCRPLCRPRAS